MNKSTPELYLTDKSIKELYNKLFDVTDSLKNWTRHRDNASTTEEAIYADCRMIHFETKYAELSKLIKLAVDEFKATV
jgi:hypothetical protein